MKYIERNIRVKKGQSIRIEPVCCIHAGNVAFDDDRYKRVIARVLGDPNRYTFGGGDYTDAIVAGDKRFRADNIDQRFSSPAKAYAYVEESIKPLAEAGKILGLGEGNHDFALQKRAEAAYTLATGEIKEFNYVKDMAANLKVPYAGVVWFLKLKFPNGFSTIINIAHGRFGGRRVGGFLNRTEDLMIGYDFDVAFRGHAHQLAESFVRRIGFDGAKDIPIVGMGSFLQGHKENVVGYAEEMDLLPRRTGTMTLEINPWTKEMHVHPPAARFYPRGNN